MEYSEVIQSPIITEKGSFLREQGFYVLKVAPASNKVLIRKAVEKLYGVKVDSVKVVNQKARVKQSMFRRGKSSRKASYKKAYVRLVGGEKISQLEV